MRPPPHPATAATASANPQRAERAKTAGEVDLQASQCTRRGPEASERGRRFAYVEAQRAEEMAALRSSLRLLDLLARNGRADGEDQAEAMFHRHRLPSGNVTATMALASHLRRQARKRVGSKPGPRKRRKWSKGLHPGLWAVSETGTNPNERAYQPRAVRRDDTMSNVGVVAIR